MITFADRLQSSIDRTKSALIAGCDPVIEKFPTFILERAAKAQTDDEFITQALTEFCDTLLDAVRGRVAAVKPNIAFFEQYGLAGLSVFKRFCDSARAAEIPVIVDAKRGDIGSTAAAYSAAFLGGAKVRGRSVTPFEGDALTINPFLGFDTLDPFVADCERAGKGLFILLQTSNPGAKDIQGLMCGEKTVSGHIADWLARNAARLEGRCGWSGLGAVVGASYPDEARALRNTLPTNLFLMPGFGAQGAGADDAVAGFGIRNGQRGGALVNVSRGLVDGNAESGESFRSLIIANTDKFNAQLQGALG
jgi:orotidine-5'-phosphate decarboxylase